MNFLVKVKKLVKNEFQKMVWQRNMLLRFVFDISQNGDAKRKEKKRKTVITNNSNI